MHRDVFLSLYCCVFSVQWRGPASPHRDRSPINTRPLLWRYEHSRSLQLAQNGPTSRLTGPEGFHSLHFHDQVYVRGVAYMLQSIIEHSIKLVLITDVNEWSFCGGQSDSKH